MKIEKETKLDYVDVLIRPQKNNLASRRDVTLERTFTFPHTSATWTGVPIISANMDDTGTITMMKSLSAHHILTALHKYHSLDELGAMDREHAFFTVGIRDEGMEMLKGYIKRCGEPKLLLIDVANGYLERFVDYIRKARALSPSSIIMAGNVVTGEMTRELVRAGADIVKVGIGPGAVCTTRVMAGVGYPQFSAVMECVKVAHKLGAYVCADGGCRNPGDVAKAFGAGADFVMIGGMFSGHAEGGREVIEVDGKKFVEHYGSSSRDAMEKHYGGKANYKASEGKKILVPYKGLIRDTVEELLGGLRSACTYVGASKIEELSSKTVFVRVNRQLSPSL